MLERVTIAEASRASAFGDWAGTEVKGLRISERRGLAIIELAAYGHGAAAREALSRALGMSLPGPGKATGDSSVAALSVGPGRWLIGGKEAAVSRLRAPSEDLAAIIDLSGGRAVLTLSGVNTVRTLMKGTAVDLDPATFPAGSVAATALQRMPAVIWRWNEGYDVIVPRSYAVAMLEWLIMAGAG